MARWTDLLRTAREAANLSRRELADLTGVSEQTIYSFESGRRHPKHETLLMLTRALKLDGAGTNDILTDAGFEPEPSAWLRHSVVASRPLAELTSELSSYTWPCLAVNERFEILAWNQPAVQVAELDFGRDLPELHQRNLLRIGAMRHFRDRVVNWSELVGLLVGMYKNYHMGNEELGEGSPYFQAVVTDIVAHDADALPALLQLWTDTPPRPQSGRAVLSVVWRVSDGTVLHFTYVASGWNEFEGVGISDFHPADAATWTWLVNHRTG
ncbi:MAG: helix-turn-helix domain-containing protein [Chloroflexi bacterium]|nr:helix-turn-helix domain-containing protein [Chloroflexota bacterium]